MSAEEIKSRPSFAGPGQDKDSEFRACAVSDLRVGVSDFKGCLGSGRGVYYGHFGQEFADSPAGGLSGSGKEPLIGVRSLGRLGSGRRRIQAKLSQGL